MKTLANSLLLLSVILGLSSTEAFCQYKGGSGDGYDSKSISFRINAQGQVVNANNLASKNQFVQRSDLSESQVKLLLDGDWFDTVGKQIGVNESSFYSLSKGIYFWRRSEDQSIVTILLQ
jgi:hypothetical protein